MPGQLLGSEPDIADVAASPRAARRPDMFLQGERQTNRKGATRQRRRVARRHDLTSYCQIVVSHHPSPSLFPIASHPRWSWSTVLSRIESDIYSHPSRVAWSQRGPGFGPPPPGTAPGDGSSLWPHLKLKVTSTVGDRRPTATRAWQLSERRRERCSYRLTVRGRPSTPRSTGPMAAVSVLSPGSPFISVVDKLA
jgi:hypothetical protein